MADTSPGKVQVLRAMFAQKNEPVMGCMKPGAKLIRPCNRSVTSLTEDNYSDEKQRISPVSVTATQAILRAIQTTDLTKKNGDVNNALCDNTQQRVLLKPTIGPKPFAFSKVQSRTFSSSNNSSSVDYNNKTAPRKVCSESNGYNGGRSELAETVASFMFGESNNQVSKSRCSTPIENKTDSAKPRASLNGTNAPSNLELCKTGENMKPKKPSDSHMNLINSDNYICKSSSNFRRRPLPPKDKIGPPPLKPVKPPHLKLPERFLNRTNMVTHAQMKVPAVEEIRPSLPPKRADASSTVLQKPPYPCPPRPLTSPPIPPSISISSASTNSLNNTSHVSKPKTLFEEIEQLYEDTLSEDSSTMIPEYTEEEEEAELEELYDDADVNNYRPPRVSHPPKPKYPPPSSHQSVYLEPNVNGIPEEIYHDTDEPLDDDEVYEVMPVDEVDEGHYSNNAKEMEKIKREEEKRLRKENKEKQKKEKEMEKLKKKFGVNGDESAIDSGLVKMDSRGSRSDLPVKKGETVCILRIEGNPVGKWLVRNKKGRYGYVELTNIEVDPNSVKSVMTVKRSSVISARGMAQMTQPENGFDMTHEELYSEAYSEQEGIYETTY